MFTGTKGSRYMRLLHFDKMLRTAAFAFNFKFSDELGYLYTAIKCESTSYSAIASAYYAL